MYYYNKFSISELISAIFKTFLKLFKIILKIKNWFQFYQSIFAKFSLIQNRFIYYMYMYV